MLINRINYENFFLLYVDGELSAAERGAVENFATANPDLQHELDMLKQTMLPKDEILFKEKKSLYRASQTDAALQEKLLLKMDDELPEGEFAFVNAAISNDEIAGRAYAQLQQTKLDASEKFVFADKHLLYRKEKDHVVIGVFLRWAAAAVILGFGIFFGISFLSKKNMQEAVVAKTPSTKNIPGTKQVSAKDTQALATIKQPGKAIENTGKDGITKIPVVVSRKNHRDPVKNISTPDPGNIQTPKQSPVLVKKENDRVPLQKTLMDDPLQQLAAVAAKEKLKADPPIDHNIVPMENGYARSASLKDDDRSENKILYMDEADVKRSGAGGIFRKVKRFVERTAKIKTGNTLRIASFEIAAK